MADSEAGPGACFERYRDLCFTTAYRMLGSVTDAEDVVQEAWLRWSARDRDEVANPRAYLVRIATRLALNRLRTLRSQRESYVGPWLPEPLVTDHTQPDAAEPALLAESASAAMLVVLETLTPAERAVFILREVFDYPHEDIASTLGRSTASVRQLARRAREHVRARRPRFSTDTSTQWRVTERFLAACQGGDLDEMLAQLSPEVMLVSDGGGKVRAARNPIRGADKVARFLAGIRPNRFGRQRVEITELNGNPGAITWLGARPDAAITLEVVDSRIRWVGLVVNPDKLTRLAAPPMERLQSDDKEKHATAF